MPDTTKGVWKLQEVRDQVLQNCWAYSTAGDFAGALFTAGSNRGGELGINSVGVSSSPIQINGTWINFSIGHSNSFNHTHMAGIKDDNTLWAWGANCIGALGQNNLTYTSSPVQIPGTTWCRVAAGSCNLMAIKTDGTMWGWGSNTSGELGFNSVTCYSSPVQIPGTTWCNISNGTSVFATKTDGTLWSMGSNNIGQLGIGNSINKSSPTQIPGTWCKVDTGVGITHALKTDNTMWAWGYGITGRGGWNSIADYSSPIQIPGSWCNVGRLYTGASGIKTDGTLWSWGYNNQNGLGSPSSSGVPTVSSPVQIPGTTWCYVRGALSVSGGGPATFAKKTDGTLWSWGAGYHGQFLDGQYRGYVGSPIQVPGRWLCAENNFENSAGLKCF